MATDHEYKVTLSIYSGRPDPSWVIHPAHASLKRIKEHHERAKSSNLCHAHHQIEEKLGYRGFLVHHKDSEHPDLIVGPHTQEFQKTLLETMPKELKTADLHQRTVQMISTSKAPSDAAKSKPAAQVKGTSDAPTLDLAKWNDDPSITRNNNCYNYGNDQITNTFAQPGNASGHPITALTAQNVKAAAMSDGLKMLDPQPGSSDPSPPTSASPSGWWNVALVVAEGEDYHWYRLDSNELWSHKPGPTKATTKDGDGNLISDPRKAANAEIPYKFVAFMITNKNVHIK